MSRSVCLYSELEPYNGSISHNLSDLPRLIWELKLACLFYDVVVVHRRNLWEHPLTLPAFEKLAPFVQSGQLWASANKLDGSPKDYVKQRIEQAKKWFVDNRGAINPTNTKNRKNAVINMKDRWETITPDRWGIVRGAEEQTDSVLKNVEGFLSQFTNKKFKPVYSLLDLVERMRADNDFDKEATLAMVGMLRGRLYPAFLSEIATLIQTEFVRAGANFNEQAIIYPGKSVQCLTNTYFGALPFDYRRLNNIKEHMKSVGFSLEELINLPVPMLFEIAQSRQWLMIRDVLWKDIFPIEIQQEMRSVFSSHLSFLNKMEKLLNISCYFENIENSTPHLSPFFLPARWALVSQSLLGNTSVAASINVKKASKAFILDLDSGVLYEENSPHAQVELTQLQTNLLAMLINVGESGLTFEHIKRLTSEFYSTEKWESQAEQAGQYIEYDDEALQNTCNVLKTRTNKELKPLGLKIAAEKGKEQWYLGNDNSVQDFLIKLSNTILGESFEQTKKKEPPQGLSPQSQVIWNCLWEYYPGFVHAKTIAEVLEKEWNENTPKQISKAIDKLEKALKNEPWTIKHKKISRRRRGDPMEKAEYTEYAKYALVPRQQKLNTLP